MKKKKVLGASAKKPSRSTLQSSAKKRKDLRSDRSRALRKPSQIDRIERMLEDLLKHNGLFPGTTSPISTKTAKDHEWSPKAGDRVTHVYAPEHFADGIVIDTNLFNNISTTPKIKTVCVRWKDGRDTFHYEPYKEIIPQQPY